MSRKLARIVTAAALTCSLAAAEQETRILRPSDGAVPDNFGGAVDVGADLTEDVATGAGNRYYLVVPHSASEEGSYGVDGAGIERPTGASTCAAAQNPATCP